MIPIPVESKGRNEPFPRADDIVALLDFLIRDIKSGKHKAVVNEFQFFAKHCVRRHNEITFLKCQFLGEVICDLCVKNPVICTKTLELIKKSGGHLFEPTPSPHKEHYLTFLEMSAIANVGEKLAESDEFLPSQLNLKTDERLGKCYICPSWIFTSITEKDRHYRMVHNKIATKVVTAKEDGEKSKSKSVSQHICRVCNRTFKTYHRLNKH